MLKNNQLMLKEIQSFLQDLKISDFDPFALTLVIVPFVIALGYFVYTYLIKRFILKRS